MNNVENDKQVYVTPLEIEGKIEAYKVESYTLYTPFKPNALDIKTAAIEIFDSKPEHFEPDLWSFHTVSSEDPKRWVDMYPGIAEPKSKEELQPFVDDYWLGDRAKPCYCSENPEDFEYVVVKLTETYERVIKIDKSQGPSLCDSFGSVECNGFSQSSIENLNLGLVNREVIFSKVLEKDVKNDDSILPYKIEREIDSQLTLIELQEIGSL